MLEKVNLPADLKRLPLPDLRVLCEDIRREIINVISQKGGHLASSLGAVELCVALHYVFNTPEDLIVFDVGHQAYAHKLLTGRKNVFHKLREYKGISGFPYPPESEYDTFAVGHAGNAVSLALGAAEALRLQNKEAKVVAVIGDGSLSSGECFEGLNNAGHLQSDILVVFNHNEMSISRSVGALSNYLSKLISLPVYNRTKEGVDTILEKVPHLGKKIVPWIKRIEEIMKGLLVPGIFFEEIGFRYFGPLDGHNIDILVPALQNIAKLKGPKLLHIITKKGKGYTSAEEDPETFHSAPRFIPQQGKIIPASQESYTDVFSRKITALAREDKKIVCLTAAMAKGTGLDKLKQEFPERVFDVGIAEQHLVSFAGGLAKQGLKPVVCLYSTFMQRAYDQIIEDILLQKAEAVFVVDRAGIVGEDGPTHHGLFDIACIRHLPDAVILCPKDRYEMEKSLEFAIGYKGAVFIRFPKQTAWNYGPAEDIKLAKAETLEPGKDFAILALGSMVEKVVNIKEKFHKQDIYPMIVNARFVKPLDEFLLEEVAKKTKLIFTLEEGVLEGGFGSAVLEFFQQKGLFGELKIVRLGIPSQFVTFGRRNILLDKAGLSEEKIFNRIMQEWDRCKFQLWQK